MDGTQVGVLKKTYVVCLRGLLQGKDGRSLEPKISLEILGNLTYQTLEGELADEKIGGLLVPTDLTKGNSSRSVTVGLLHTSGEAGGLTCLLGGELLTGGFASGGLTGGLFGTGHIFIIINYYYQLYYYFNFDGAST
jgi:hypothetical protein